MMAAACFGDVLRRAGVWFVGAGLIRKGGTIAPMYGGHSGPLQDFREFPRCGEA